MKELALLSNWPPFDLYFSGNSNDALQKGYNIRDTTAKTQPHAWYIGAPPDILSGWAPHWIAGPSQHGAVCDQSIGSLLHAVLEKKGRLSNSIGVGKEFKFDKARLQPARTPHELDAHASPPNWNDLCHQLMLGCKKYELPKSLFGAQMDHGRIVGASVVYSNPIGMVLKTVWEWISSLWAQSKKIDHPKRYPVVVVVRKSGEYDNF